MTRCNRSGRMSAYLRDRHACSTRVCSARLLHIAGGTSMCPARTRDDMCLHWSSSSGKSPLQNNVKFVGRVKDHMMWQDYIEQPSKGALPGLIVLAGGGFFTAINVLVAVWISIFKLRIYGFGCVYVYGYCVCTRLIL